MVEATCRMTSQFDGGRPEHLQKMDCVPVGRELAQNVEFHLDCLHSQGWCSNCGPNGISQITFL